MPQTKEFIIQIVRDREHIGLKLKGPEELEELFQELSDQVVRSSVWKMENGDGAEFYKVNESYDKIEETITKHTFNDYGSGLVQEGEINLAPLRTKGLANGVEIYSDRFSQTNGIEIETYCRKLAQATKKIMENFLQEKEVTAKLTITL